MHNPPAEVSFEAQKDSVFYRINPSTFTEPPPAFEKFKKTTKSTQRVQIENITGIEKVGKIKTDKKKKGKQTEATEMVEYCMGRKGKTTLSIDGSTGKRIYQFETFQSKQYTQANRNFLLALDKR